MGPDVKHRITEIKGISLSVCLCVFVPPHAPPLSAHPAARRVHFANMCIRSCVFE